MKIAIDKNSKIEVEYTALAFGKLVLTIPNDQAENVLKSAFESCGLEPLFAVLDDSDILQIKGWLNDKNLH